MCIEALREQPGIEVVGAVSNDATGRDQLGIPVLGRQSDLGNITQSENINAFCVAIGANRVRQDLVEKLTQSGHSNAKVISGTAVISPSADLGDGVQVMPAAVVTAMASIGEGTIVNTNASVDHDAQVGDYVHIAPGVAIAGDVTIGDRTLIGIGARVLPGLTIGSDVVVGAGAVVIDDVPSGQTVVGVPARPIDRVDP